MNVQPKLPQQSKILQAPLGIGQSGLPKMEEKKMSKVTPGNMGPSPLPHSLSTMQ